MLRARIGNTHPLQDTMITHHPQIMDLALRRIATLRMALQPLLFHKTTQGFFNFVNRKEIGLVTSFRNASSATQSSGRSEDTEQDVALAPSAYWSSALRGESLA
ncbi:hypothetical protein N7504_004598 [Penicillium tannophilum]|nr:hypothetical protein N7504_004598 [Penicillium tannophilum]